MKTIQYTGGSDVQEFSHADFAKADLDQGKLRFKQGVPQEVEDDVADALTSTSPEESPIFHDFSFEEVEVEEEEEHELRGKELAAAVDAANEEGADIPSSATADEKRAALKAFEAS